MAVHTTRRGPHHQLSLIHILLSAAYERCVDNTGKFNVNYINKVLEGWRKNGVRNLQELEELETKKLSLIHI